MPKVFCKCSFCDKTFKSENNAIMHERWNCCKHGEWRFTCGDTQEQMDGFAISAVCKKCGAETDPVEPDANDISQEELARLFGLNGGQQKIDEIGLKEEEEE